MDKSSMEEHKIQTKKNVLIVTGGSRGIGAATAIQAANEGYAVCINYIDNKKSAEKVADKIMRINGECTIVQADVSIEAEVIRLFKTVEQRLGPVTALVNNVGILKEKMKLADMSSDRIKKVLITNVMSSFLCSREAVRRMTFSMGGKGGGIVNVSSAASRLGSANEYIDYAASKGAIDSLTIGLSKEVADDGVRVNAVRPGCIYTDIHADGGEPERVKRIEEFLPMRRGGQPEEVAKAIMWLLSDKASYVTGSFIDLAGGN